MPSVSPTNVCPAAAPQKTEQQLQLEALERLAKQKAEEESQKRKEDEARAQYLLGVQQSLKEAEERARQAEQKKAAEAEANRIWTEYEAELRALNEKHAQAKVEHKYAVAIQEEKIRRFQAAQDQDQLRQAAASRVQQQTTSPPVTVIPAGTRLPEDTVTAQLAQLTSIVNQLVQANQSQTSTTRISGKAQSEVKPKTSQAKTGSNSTSTSCRSKKSRAVTPGDPYGSGSESGDSSSSDSSQDDLESQFGAVTQPKSIDPSSGTRVVVQAMIPHDALEKFNEYASLEDRVNWWERFMYYATMAPWDERTRIVQVRMRLSGALKDWCTQLSDDVCADWKQLSHTFKREWCRSVGSKAERYYEMRMRDPHNVSYRLNHAAKRAIIANMKPIPDREAHIRRFIKALGDSRLRTTLQGQQFDALSELEETLKRIEALQRDESRDYQQQCNPAQNLQFGRFKPPQRRSEGRSFLAEGDNADSESGRHVHFKDDFETPLDDQSGVEIESRAENLSVQETKPSGTKPSEPVGPSFATTLLDEEIFRVAEKLSWKPRSQPRDDEFQRAEACGECGSSRHATDKCWSKLICGCCHEEGHPTQYCRRQSCSKCGDYHRRGLCDMWSALKAVQEVVRTGGSIEGLAPEVGQALLDGPGSGTPLNQ